MREIKFRAWDKKENKMWGSVGFSDSDCGRRIIQETYMIGGGEVAPIFDTWENMQRQRFILMQYAGLKDKNGKEIYEGDIIRHSNLSEKLTIEFRDGAFGYEYYKEFHKQPLGMQTYIKDWYIIGNIHENPDAITNAV